MHAHTVREQRDRQTGMFCQNAYSLITLTKVKAFPKRFTAALTQRIELAQETIHEAKT